MTFSLFLVKFIKFSHIVIKSIQALIQLLQILTLVFAAYLDTRRRTA